MPQPARRSRSERSRSSPYMKYRASKPPAASHASRRTTIAAPEAKPTSGRGAVHVGDPLSHAPRPAEAEPVHDVAGRVDVLAVGERDERLPGAPRRVLDRRRAQCRHAARGRLGVGVQEEQQAPARPARPTWQPAANPRLAPVSSTAACRVRAPDRVRRPVAATRCRRRRLVARPSWARTARSVAGASAALSWQTTITVTGHVCRHRQRSRASGRRGTARAPARRRRRRPPRARRRAAAACRAAARGPCSGRPGAR